MTFGSNRKPGAVSEYMLQSIENVDPKPSDLASLQQAHAAYKIFNTPNLTEHNNAAVVKACLYVVLPTYCFNCSVFHGSNEKPVLLDQIRAQFPNSNLQIIGVVQESPSVHFSTNVKGDQIPLSHPCLVIQKSDYQRIFGSFLTDGGQETGDVFLFDRDGNLIRPKTESWNPVSLAITIWKQLN